ncbi:MAG: hypothetical protein JWO08_3572 [Verrucomicrobiaceae bacterium]|nr:hypothetical protein [Verrucomicrobiaceae bacterium]
MSFEELQKSWQAQAPARKISIDADLLLKEVRRNQSQFRTTIFWRDFREVGVAACMIICFLYHGVRHHDWSNFLVVAACAWVGAFMLIDRLAQRKKTPLNQDPLKACIEASHAQVSHQIWLLRNVFWWYLLPIAAAILLPMWWTALHKGPTGTHLSAFVLRTTFFMVCLNWGIYRLNQNAVKKGLEPRRKELETMLAGLQ